MSSCFVVNGREWFEHVSCGVVEYLVELSRCYSKANIGHYSIFFYRSKYAGNFVSNTCRAYYLVVFCFHKLFFLTSAVC